MSYLFLFAGCGRNFTSPEGRIVSPNYPGQYDNNLNCSYIIDQGPQSLVILEFETFHLEGNWFFVISVCAMNVTSYLKTFKCSVMENGWWFNLLVHSKNYLLANICRDSVHGVSFVSVKASRRMKIEYLTCWASCSNEAGNLPDGWSIGRTVANLYVCSCLFLTIDSYNLLDLRPVLLFSVSVSLTDKMDINTLGCFHIWKWN